MNKESSQDITSVSSIRHDPLEGVTTNGMITTGAHQSRLAREFRPALDAAIEQVSSLSEDYSLYVYGSVATGTAQVGRSDVDLMTFFVGETKLSEYFFHAMILASVVEDCRHYLR